MLLIAGKKDVLPTTAGLTHQAAVGTFDVRYSLFDDEYACHGERFIILADTIVDRSRLADLDHALAGIAESLASGLPWRPFELGAHFLVVMDKQSGAISVHRDPSGIKTGYYYINEDAVFISTCVHDVAEAAGVCEFDDEAIHQLLYFQYTFDGDTFYRSVHEVPMGHSLKIETDLNITIEENNTVRLAEGDNSLSFEENQRRLRESIIDAHRKYLSKDNVVLLSGGLDSAVMLGSLNELSPSESLRAVSFKVDGTTEDETVYARSASENLGVPLRIVSIDPERLGSFETFQRTIRRMNNPYYGYLLFGRLPDPGPSQTYFAGQDTRLHTPDINLIDKLAINVSFNRHRRLSGLVLSLLRMMITIRALFSGSGKRPKWRRMIARIDDSRDLQQYLLKHTFGCDPQFLADVGIPMQRWESLRDKLRVDLDSIENPRQLYNEIARIKCREQFAEQTRYIQSLARICGTYIALPFHDDEFISFSSSIPFAYATRLRVGLGGFSRWLTLISKQLLRRAFRDKLNARVYNRKKAVSSSLHLLFNGRLGDFARSAFDDDLADENSFLKKYDLEPMLDRFRSREEWCKEDEKYLYRVYYATVLCLYNKLILNPNRRKRHQREERWAK